MKKIVMKDGNFIGYIKIDSYGLTTDNRDIPIYDDIFPVVDVMLDKTTNEVDTIDFYKFINVFDCIWGTSKKELIDKILEYILSKDQNNEITRMDTENNYDDLGVLRFGRKIFVLTEKERKLNNLEKK